MPFASRNSPPRALIVDDDEGLNILIVQALTQTGMDVVPAYSGKEARQILKKEKFDLMLLDLNLKDISGKSLLEAVRNDGTEIPFIVVTGRGDERTAVEMMKQGALDYFIKDARMLDRLPITVTRAMEKLDRDRALEAARAALIESEKQILVISERERESIGADLHDNLGQQLTAIELLCQAMRQDLARQPKLEARMAQICRFLQESVAQTRQLARGLTPVTLSEAGLADSLSEMVRRMGVGKVQCHFKCTGTVDRLDTITANHLFRIAQEAVNNSLKHSHATKVDVDLVVSREAIVLTIKDDGKGFDNPKERLGGLGLQIMQHRATVIGARLKIDSPEDQGVTIICHLKLHP